MATPVHPYSDYGVALRTLKSARSWLSFLLLICVIVQFIGFGLMYSTQQPYTSFHAQYTKTKADVLRDKLLPLLQEYAGIDPATGVTTQDWFPRTQQGQKLNIRDQWNSTYTMVVPVTQVLGMVAASSQIIIVFLALLLILIARAPGVAQVTRSLVWTILLSFIVFPWQYVFSQGFPIPGIFWGYREMLSFIGPVVAGEPYHTYQKFLIILRFIIWPLFSLVVLLFSSECFRGGVMLSIGHPLQSMMGMGNGNLPPSAASSGRPTVPNIPKI